MTTSPNSPCAVSLTYGRSPQGIYTQVIQTEEFSPALKSHLFCEVHMQTSHICSEISRKQKKLEKKLIFLTLQNKPKAVPEYYYV